MKHQHRLTGCVADDPQGSDTHRSCGQQGCAAPVARAGIRRSSHPEGILCVWLHATHLSHPMQALLCGTCHAVCFRWR